MAGQPWPSPSFKPLRSPPEAIPSPDPEADQPNSNTHRDATESTAPEESNDQPMEERPLVPPPIMADKMIDPTPIGTGLAQPLAEPDEN